MLNPTSGIKLHSKYEQAVNELRKKKATTFNFVTEKKTGGL
jgi:hypothetical protein